MVEKDKSGWKLTGPDSLACGLPILPGLPASPHPSDHMLPEALPSTRPSSPLLSGQSHLTFRFWFIISVCPVHYCSREVHTPKHTNSRQQIQLSQICGQRGRTVMGWRRLPHTSLAPLSAALSLEAEGFLIEWMLTASQEAKRKGHSLLNPGVTSLMQILLSQPTTEPRSKNGKVWGPTSHLSLVTLVILSGDDSQC